MRIVYAEASEKIRTIVSECVKFVSKTYGPAGRKILIQDEYRIRSVDDGKVVLENYELENEFDNSIIKYIQEATKKTDSRVGDGTTTSLIITAAIVNIVLSKLTNKLIAKNPVGYVEEIKKGAKEAVQTIRDSAKQIKDKKELYEVALNSSNDEEIAQLISDTLYKIGKDGVITVQDSTSHLTEVSIKEGLEIEKGYASPYLINSGDKVVLNNPYVLLVNKRLDNIDELLPVIKSMLAEKNGNFVVVAEGFGNTVLGNMIVNKVNNVISPLLVENPAYGEQKLEFLKDLQSVCGGEIVDSNVGIELKDITIDKLGRISSISSSKDSTVITQSGRKTAINDRVKELKKQLEKASTDYEKDKITRRIAALLGGVSIIKVGANTQNEQETKKLKVEDAVNASRHAFRTGIVKGAGKTFESIKTSSEVLNEALKEPRKKLIENGEEFLDDKVYDPADVLIAALESAVSIGCGLIEMSGIISTKREKKETPQY